MSNEHVKQCPNQMAYSNSHSSLKSSLVWFDGRLRVHFNRYTAIDADFDHIFNLSTTNITTVISNVSAKIIDKKTIL